MTSGVSSRPAAPANVLNAESVSKAHGTTQLLDGVSLGLAAGDRIGVVGANGAGKTTLLRVLTRCEEPDAGRVTHRSGLRIGMLSQQVDLPAVASVADVVVGSAWLGEAFGAVHEWAGDAAVRSVLDGLGLPDIGLEAPVGPLSGGERRRVALAALLVRDYDLLVLDEPTNHLDVEGVAWLAAHLRRTRPTLLVVTHDRWFLDEVCTGTWEVVDGQVHRYDGGYAAYVLARAERTRVAAATESRRLNLVRKELAWLRRGPPARTSKPRFRIEAANALIADVPPIRDEARLRRFAATRLGKDVYDVEGVSLRLGQRTLLADVTWRIGPGDRLGLVGVNGSGKTTLLRLLTGELVPDTGRVKVGATVRVAYLSQEVTELPAGRRVLEVTEDVAKRIRLGDRELTASQVLETFGFASVRQWTPVGELSGGERRRLQLLRLLMAEPNVLLLDEPTNDLDIDTLTALEDLLDSWPGTLIVVSHDRYLIERVCEAVVALLGDGQLRPLTGGVEEYLRRREALRAAGGSGGGGGAAAGGGGSGGAGSGGGGSGAKGIREARKELARLERRLAQLEKREHQLAEEIDRNATDHVRLIELDREVKAVRAERAAVEDAWLELAG
jgi:ATP-binding cassette subfamily F protein uup